MSECLSVEQICCSHIFLLLLLLIFFVASLCSTKRKSNKKRRRVAAGRDAHQQQRQRHRAALHIFCWEGKSSNDGVHGRGCEKRGKLDFLIGHYLHILYEPVCALYIRMYVCTYIYIYIYICMQYNIKMFIRPEEITRFFYFILFCPTIPSSLLWDGPFHRAASYFFFY